MPASTIDCYFHQHLLTYGILVHHGCSLCRMDIKNVGAYRCSSCDYDVCSDCARNCADLNFLLYISASWLSHGISMKESHLKGVKFVKVLKNNTSDCDACFHTSHWTKVAVANTDDSKIVCCLCLMRYGHTRSIPTNAKKIEKSSDCAWCKRTNLLYTYEWNDGTYCTWCIESRSSFVGYSKYEEQVAAATEKEKKIGATKELLEKKTAECEQKEGDLCATKKLLEEKTAECEQKEVDLSATKGLLEKAQKSLSKAQKKCTKAEETLKKNSVVNSEIKQDHGFKTARSIRAMCDEEKLLLKEYAEGEETLEIVITQIVDEITSETSLHILRHVMEDYKRIKEEYGTEETFGDLKNTIKRISSLYPVADISGVDRRSIARFDRTLSKYLFTFTCDKQLAKNNDLGKPKDCAIHLNKLSKIHYPIFNMDMRDYFASEVCELKISYKTDVVRITQKIKEDPSGFQKDLLRCTVVFPTWDKMMEGVLAFLDLCNENGRIIAIKSKLLDPLHNVTVHFMPPAPNCPLAAEVQFKLEVTSTVKKTEMQNHFLYELSRTETLDNFFGKLGELYLSLESKVL